MPTKGTLVDPAQRLRPVHATTAEGRGALKGCRSSQGGKQLIKSVTNRIEKNLREVLHDI
eukprot:scaffold489_cov259-Pinguiococcus_pyrenoidosus.AAC.8